VRAEREIGANSQDRPSTRPDPAVSINTVRTAPFPTEPDEILLFDMQPHRAPVTVEIIVPVYNEEAGLERSITRLHHYLAHEFPLPAIITIADNASVDNTWSIACRLTQSLDGVRAAHLDVKGRGRALRALWSRSDAPVVAYMDVDLSTDLGALLPLVAPLVSGHSDLAIGTRLAPTASVARGPRREAISRSYNLLLKMTLHAGFSDAQCGFKAGRTDAIKALLPLVEDQSWFFDTELLMLAEHNGLRIHEVPVDWVDDRDSRVRIASTARDDLKGMWRLLRSFAKGRGHLAEPVCAHRTTPRRGIAEQLVRFASIGLVSTIAFAALFVLLVGPLGILGADIVALGLCTLANTAANRRLTFAVRGRTGRARHQARGLAVALIPLTLNVLALGALAAAGVGGVAAFVVALTLVNALGSFAKFTLLQSWVFRES